MVLCKAGFTRSDIIDIVMTISLEKDKAVLHRTQHRFIIGLVLFDVQCTWDGQAAVWLTLARCT